MLKKPVYPESRVSVAIRNWQGRRGGRFAVNQELPVQKRVPGFICS